MLYTGKGDTGTTKLYGCSERVSKSDSRIALLGALDELNSFAGFCRALAVSEEAGEMEDALLAMQEDLFVIQAVVAGAPKWLLPERLAALEALIGAIEKELPPIRSFTIAGATPLSGALDIARAVARRAEREMVACDAGVKEFLPYLNRLSSALFALARLAAHRAGIAEKAPRY